MVLAWAVIVRSVVEAVEIVIVAAQVAADSSAVVQEVQVVETVVAQVVPVEIAVAQVEEENVVVRPEDKVRVVVVPILVTTKSHVAT